MTEHTDKEWREMVQDWKDRLRAYALVDGYTGALRIIGEMEVILAL